MNDSEVRLVGGKFHGVRGILPNELINIKYGFFGLSNTTKSGRTVSREWKPGLEKYFRAGKVDGVFSFIHENDMPTLDDSFIKESEWTAA